MTPLGFSTIPCRNPMTTATARDSTERRALTRWRHASDGSTAGGCGGWGCRPLGASEGSLSAFDAVGAHTDNARSAGAEELEPAVYAYILIQTAVGKQADVSSEIARLDGVISADPVTGPYDVIVRSESDTLDDLGRGILAKIEAVEGITRTLTCPIVSF